MADRRDTEPTKTALVVGCGSIGTRHAENLSDLGVEVSVFDVDQSRRRELADRIDGKPRGSLEEGLDECPDMVVVSTPSNHHVEPAMKAARAGCDLFVEKPLSNNLDRIPELLTEAQQRDLVTMVGSNFRFHPAITTIKRLVDDAAVGNVVSVRIEAGSYLPDWQSGVDYRELYSSKAGVGGALLDYIHELNYARWLFGDVQTVTGMVGSQSSLEIETEDTATLVARFEDGTLCEIHVDYVQRSYSRSCHVIGEEGTIRWEWDWSSVRRYDPESDSWITEASWEDDWEMNDMYVDEMKHFLTCVEKRAKTRSTLPEGYRDLQVAMATKDSASSGKHVEL